MSTSALIPIQDQPHRNIRVGRCDGTNSFVAVADATESKRAVVFLFDAGGYFLRAIRAKPRDALNELQKSLTQLLA